MDGLEIKFSGIIQNWAIVTEDAPYKAPEAMGVYVLGTIFGSSSFASGSPIRTSQVQDFAEDFSWVKTANNYYKLGEIQEGFKKWMQENGFTLSDYKSVAQ